MDQQTSQSYEDKPGTSRDYSEEAGPSHQNYQKDDQDGDYENMEGLSDEEYGLFWSFDRFVHYCKLLCYIINFVLINKSYKKANYECLFM